MRIEIIKKLVRVRNILLSKGYTIVPRPKFSGNLKEIFINGKFSVELDVLGNVSSKKVFHSMELIEQCKEYWYNNRDILYIK